MVSDLTSALQGPTTQLPLRTTTVCASDSVAMTEKCSYENDHHSVATPNEQSHLYHQPHSNHQSTEVHDRRSQSMNSLSTEGDLPMLSRQWQTSNHHFPTLHEHRRSTIPMVSSNPLLQMMEQRMAAHAAFLQASLLHDQRQSVSQPIAQCNPLLQKMEQRMATTQSSTGQLYANTNAGSFQDTGIPASLQSTNALNQSSSTQQLDLMKAMMSSRMSQQANAHAQQMFLSQTSAMAQTSTAHHGHQNHSSMHRHGMSNDLPVLSRCAHSLSELERLRQENQLIQFRQQLLQGKTRRTSLNSTFESQATSLSGQPSPYLLKRSSSSSSSSTLGKRASEDDSCNCSYGSMSSISSNSRKLPRSTSIEQRSLRGSDEHCSTELLNTRIQKVSLHAQPSEQPHRAAPTILNKKPQKKSYISTLLAQQTKVDTVDQAEAVGISLQTSMIKPPGQVKMTTIISEVPDRIKYQNVNSETKPFDVVREALSSRGLDYSTKPSRDMEDGFFVNITEMYGHEVVSAIRSNNIDSVMKLHADGTNFQCGNQFGETLIHLACRRCHRELVSFLVKEAGVSLRVRDDYGRTPMHDLCWRANPDLELFDILLEYAPELLMLSDDRGHTPLDYSRREHWDVLIPFLLERTKKFQPVKDDGKNDTN